MLLFIAFFLNCKTNKSESKYLFKENGKAWIAKGDASWSFQQGDLVGVIRDGSGFVMTDEEYSDFVLELDFFPDSTINSGVFIRCKEKELSAKDCYEINIWDEHPDQSARTGAVVKRVPPLNFIKTAGQWNSYKIVSRKNRITAWINSIQVVDLSDSTLVTGVYRASGGWIGKDSIPKYKTQFNNRIIYKTAEGLL